jgi:hypothetical protein
LSISEQGLCADALLLDVFIFDAEIAANKTGSINDEPIAIFLAVELFIAPNLLLFEVVD